jgi:hypothetical protein
MRAVDLYDKTVIVRALAPSPMSNFHSLSMPHETHLDPFIHTLYGQVPAIETEVAYLLVNLDGIGLITAHIQNDSLPVQKEATCTVSPV